MNRVKDGLLVKKRVGIYHAFIEPHLDYCSAIWSTASAQLRRTLTIAQNDALRAVFNYPSRKRVDEMYAEAGVVEAAKRWRRSEAVWLYRILKCENSLPSYLKDLVTVTKSFYGLRSDRIDVDCLTAVSQTKLAWRLRQLFSESRVQNALSMSSSLDVFKLRISEFL